MLSSPVALDLQSFESREKIHADGPLTKPGSDRTPDRIGIFPFGAELLF